MASERVYRVTIRGQFHDLSDEARRSLVAAQPEHDVFLSAYTPEGTFTYDARIAFFNLRYEVRCDPDDTDRDPARVASAEAEAFLRTMKFGHRNLTTDVVDVSAIWDDVARRRTI